jgi:hypothetical protein
MTLNKGILRLYAKGIYSCGIVDSVEETYGIEIIVGLVSQVTCAVMG